MDNQFSDESSLHNYRTEIPNILLDLKLSPTQLAVYIAIKRSAGDKGLCIKSSKKLCEEVQIDIRRYRKEKEFLSSVHPILGKPLIKIEERYSQNGDRLTDKITIIDLWPDNFQKFYGGRCNSVGGVGANLQGGWVQNCTPKKNSYKEDHFKKQQQSNIATHARDPEPVIAAASNNNSLSFDSRLESEKIFYLGSNQSVVFLIRQIVYEHFLKKGFSKEQIAGAIKKLETKKQAVSSPMKLLEIFLMEIKMSKPIEEKKPYKPLLNPTKINLKDLK